VENSYNSSAVISTLKITEDQQHRGEK